METVEIRLNKKTILPMMAILSIALLGMTYYTFFTDAYTNNLTMKIVNALLAGYLGWNVYGYVTNVSAKKVEITLTENAIQLHRIEQPQVFFWNEIREITVDYVSEDGYYLNLTIPNRTVKLNVSWLDKTPDQLRELVNTYIKNASTIM